MSKQLESGMVELRAYEPIVGTLCTRLKHTPRRTRRRQRLPKAYRMLLRKLLLENREIRKAIDCHDDCIKHLFGRVASAEREIFSIRTARKATFSSRIRDSRVLAFIHNKLKRTTEVPE